MYYTCPIPLSVNPKEIIEQQRAMAHIWLVDVNFITKRNVSAPKKRRQNLIYTSKEEKERYRSYSTNYL